MAEEAVLTKGQDVKVNPAEGMDRECVVAKILAEVLARQRANAKSKEQRSASVKSEDKPLADVGSDEQRLAEVIISHDALRERMAEVMGQPFEEQKGTLYRYRINGGECVEQFIPFTTRVTETPLYTTVYETNEGRGNVKVRLYESPSRVYFRVDCTKKLGWEYLRDVVYGDDCKQHLDECCAKASESGSAVETPSQVSVSKNFNDGRVWA